MLGDDALIMSHRLQRVVAHAPGAGGGGRAGQHRARPARPGPAAARPGRRGRRVGRATKTRYAFLRGTRASSATCGSSSSDDGDFGQAIGAAAGLLHLAAGAAGSAAGIARPGAGGGRGQGRQGAHLPPRLRRPDGWSGSVTARVLARARVQAAWTHVVAARRRAVHRRRDVETRLAAAGVGVDPADVRAEFDAVLDAVLSAATLHRPRDGVPPRPGSDERDGVHTEALAVCWPSCRASRAPIRRRRGDARQARSAGPRGRRSRARPRAAAC